MKKQLTNQKLYILQAGYAVVKEYFVNTSLGRENNRRSISPVPVYLLETSDGPVLIDTGWAEVCLNNPHYYNGTSIEDIILPYVRDQEKVTEMLSALGYKTQDIQYLITTHLHVDHAGGHKYFPDIPVYIQQNELNMLDVDDYSPAECRLHHLNYVPVKGDHALCDNILLLSTPGHSPGHQSVLLKTETTGWILLAADAALTEANFNNETGYIAGDTIQAAASMDKLREVAHKYQAKIIFGHDPLQNWLSYPDYY